MQNTKKFIETHIVSGIVILVMILAFIFFNKMNVEPVKEDLNQEEQLVSQLMGEDKELPHEVTPYFRSMVFDFFGQIIENGYLVNTDFDEQEKNLTLYLDSNILRDEMAETWITGLGVQVMGEIENMNDFILKSSIDEKTGQYNLFAVYGIPSGTYSQLPDNFRDLAPDAIEIVVNNDLDRADTLDLVIQGKIFAHFENGKVFSELERLGLVGVTLVEGKLFVNVGASKIEVMAMYGENVFYFPNLQE